MNRPENYHKELAGDYEKSGMTMLAFCKEKGITYALLRYAIEKGKRKKEPALGSCVKIDLADTVTFSVGRTCRDAYSFSVGETGNR